VFLLLAVFSSVGLPGLNGFVGEFIILLGTFSVNWGAAAFGTLGIVLAAWYLLMATRRVLFGTFNPANNGLRDMNGREMIIALLLVVFFFVIGLFPNLLFDKINPTTAQLADQIGAPTRLADR
jgi:NADH-quinone oxidoreductase subunit M